jgi:hypothetical protein
VADDLARWAAERAPDLLARAEREAVAVLRDALVAAATGGGRPARGPARRQPEGDDGEVLWTYGVVASGTTLPGDLTGVGGGAVRPVEADGLVALAGPVPRAEFGAEPLRDNLNDLAWLERVAREHEAVLDRVLAETTLVPLRLCTIFEDVGGVRAMLDRERDALADALERLEGREEWGVKLLVDGDRMAARVGPAEAATGEGGAAYLERRRYERETREAVRGLAAQIAGDVHTRLLECAVGGVRLPAQNRELSGHEGDMLLNAAYLVDAARVPALHAAVEELRERHEGLGARLELTGPWPPYNFVTGEPAPEPA